ncbi:MAG: type VII secretion protein EccB [Micrococcales bacterium]|nr:MAG: type VII secretion protein EccB [Micrococcales bacterium]PIE26376.1 MAG: type VII secretion protein EccB [Micrococcales bacterium]
MPARPSAAQVGAYTFAQQRVRHAVATGRALPGASEGPSYVLTFVIGVVISGVLLAGAGVLGFLRPAPSVGAATVVIDRDSGRVFVVIDDVLHPATNLASALLAAGSGSQGVRQVNSAAIQDRPRGPLIGILNAPQQVPDPEQLRPNTWSVCDYASVDAGAPPGTAKTVRTTALIGEPAAAGTVVGEGSATLVTADRQTYFVLRDGRRSLLATPDDSALLSSLGLHLGSAQQVSVGLLNSVPQGPDLGIPHVPGAGAPTQWSAAVAVGDLVRSESATGRVSSFIALADGVQPVTDVVADVMRAQEVPEHLVPAAGLGPVRAGALDLSAFPQQRLAPVAVADGQWLCTSWWLDGDGVSQRRITVSDESPVPDFAAAVPMTAVREGTGAADAVYLRPQHGLLVRASDPGSSVQTGTVYLITDQGIAYPVPADDGVLGFLGLGDVSVPSAPAELVSLLRTGPVLEPEAARRVVAAE